MQRQLSVAWQGLRAPAIGEACRSAVGEGEPMCAHLRTVSDEAILDAVLNCPSVGGSGRV